jgi:uncharacterized protein (DUF58 family)
MTGEILRGPYVGFSELLALRHRPALESRLGGSVVSRGGGLRLSKHRGRGVDFAEVRPYQPGDDVRAIDWRVTARKAVTHTKVFREERERLNLLVIDQSQSMFFGSRVRLKSVAAAEFAALAVWRAIHQYDRVGGVIIGNAALAMHRPYRNLKPVARFLGDLARFNQALRPGAPLPGRQHIEDALLRVRRLARSRHRICVVSDFLPVGDHWRDAFRALARHNEVYAVRVFDPLEAELPPADRYTVADSRERWQFDSGGVRIRERHRARFEAAQADFENLCRQTGVGYAMLPTDRPVAELPGLP